MFTCKRVARERSAAGRGQTAPQIQQALTSTSAASPAQAPSHDVGDNPSACTDTTAARSCGKHLVRGPVGVPQAASASYPGNAGGLRVAARAQPTPHQSRALCRSASVSSRSFSCTRLSCTRAARCVRQAAAPRGCARRTHAHLVGTPREPLDAVVKRLEVLLQQLRCDDAHVAAGVHRAFHVLHAARAPTALGNVEHGHVPGQG